MNPYLEQEDVWHDFHERWIPAAAALESQVGPAYIVQIDEHKYIHDQPAVGRQFHGRADVYIAERSGGETPSASRRRDGADGGRTSRG